MERLHINHRLIRERGMLKTNNQNINNGIFQRDSFSPLLFCIALITLSIKIKKDTKLPLKNKPHILYKRFKVIRKKWCRFRMSNKDCKKDLETA